MVWTWIWEWAVLFALVGLWLYARYWKRAASKVLFQYALACHKKEDRDVLARRAVMAGNRPARLLYALNNPEYFDKARPMRPFLFGNIPCIFGNYYFRNAMMDGCARNRRNLYRRYMHSRKVKRIAGSIFPGCSKLSVMKGG